MTMKIQDKISYGLLAVGAINWGLFGAFSINLVEKLVGTGIGTTIVYSLIGLSAIELAIQFLTGKVKGKMSKLDITAISLIIVGGINWGLNIFNKNLVNMLLGKFGMLENIIYIIIGIAGLYSLLSWKKVK